MGGVGLPALPHEDVDVDGAVGRAFHSVTIAQELEELLNVRDGGVGRGTQGHDLPEEDAKGPDVRVGGVPSLVEEGLGGHPADGHHALVT